jgi:bifunctional ADP-heptose synthase (sugar kinase/adenylyltransferase)
MNIWVNGCFDILHLGHIDLLWYAKLYGTDDSEILPITKQNKLFVGIDSDERVKKAKGDKRPINDIETRVKILSNLRMVNDVFIFSSDEELEYYVKALGIDYIIVGDQYRNKRVVGSQFARRGVDFYPVDNRSTTNIIKKIKEL